MPGIGRRRTSALRRGCLADCSALRIVMNIHPPDRRISFYFHEAPQRRVASARVPRIRLSGARCGCREPGPVRARQAGAEKATWSGCGHAGESAVPRESLLSIEGYADDLPRVPPDVLTLARFAADYYQYPLGLTLAHAVPPRGRQSAPIRPEQPSAYRLTEAGIAGIHGLPARARGQIGLAAALRGRAYRASNYWLAHPRLACCWSRWLAAGWIESAPEAPDTKRDGMVVLPGLNAGQGAAVQAIVAAAGTFQPFLLHGVTASGKTEVYLSAAAAVIANGQQVLMLVPEINLTPQLADRIRRALPFARIVQLHSNLPAAQRLAAWRDAAEGSAQFVLGTRLAVFAPCPVSGSSSSTKNTICRTSNRMACATQRAIWLYIGPACATFRSCWAAPRPRWRRCGRHAADATGCCLCPTARSPAHPRLSGWCRSATSRRWVGLPLHCAPQSRCALHAANSRCCSSTGGVGAPSLLCVACAWAAHCQRCSARLVVHLEEKCLRCHHCGYEEPIARACPECGKSGPLPLGFGTQRLEAVLRELFSQGPYRPDRCRFHAPERLVVRAAGRNSRRETRYPGRHSK